MKKNVISIILVAVIGLVFVAIGTLTAAEKRSDVPAEIEINCEGYKKDKYGPLQFSHGNHSGVGNKKEAYKNPKGKPIACSECHHDYDKDGKNIWKDTDPVQKCGECHDPKKSDGKKKKLQLAFHKNCKDCHKKAVKAGITKDAPYKKCADCMGKKK